MASAARGDVSAFEALYDRHAPWVRAWTTHALGPHDAPDALQEIFLRVWRAAAQFDPARGRVATWLAAITRHYVARQIATRRPSLGQIEAALTDGRAQQAADEPALQREREQAVLRALRGLPIEQRRVVVLAYFAGMTQTQIAEHLGIPLGTAKKRIRLAMQKLRPAVQEEGIQPPRLRMVTDE